MSTYLLISLGVAAILGLACLAGLRLRAISGQPASKIDEIRSETWRETERLYCAGLDLLRNDDFERAARELGLAAERGHARAQLYFGVLREQGLGVQADLESARQWYRRAAAQGDADAYSRLRVLSDAPGPQPAAQIDGSAQATEPGVATDVPVLKRKNCDSRSVDVA